MTLETHVTIVNGHRVETGCYVDGHWGQYGPDHLADRAEGFGWEPRMVSVDGFDKSVADDPRVWRALAESLDILDHRDLAGEIWEFHTESADAIEQWLNDHTAVMCATCGAAISWADDANADIDEPQWLHVDWGEHEEPIVPRRFLWHWHDGEFFLSPICDDDKNCTDDTCAHWCFG